MQDCFREHPDIYGAELEDDSDEGISPEDTEAATSLTTAPLESESPITSLPKAREDETQHRAQAAKAQVEAEHGEPTSESDAMVPKAAHDATGVNAGK